MTRMTRVFAGLSWFNLIAWSLVETGSQKLNESLKEGMLRYDKAKAQRPWLFITSCRGERIRTSDLVVPNDAR